MALVSGSSIHTALLICILFVELCVYDILIWDGNVPGSLLKVHRSDVAERRVQYSLLVLQSAASLLFAGSIIMLLLPLLHCLFKFDGTRILHFLNALNLIVSETVHVNSLMLVQVGASDIAEERHCVVFLVGRGFNNVETIGNHIGMLNSPR